jgi:hypothetical protein
MIIPSYLVTLWALLFVSCGPTVTQSVAVFDFELIDTSLEGAIRGARADEQERLARLSDPPSSANQRGTETAGTRCCSASSAARLLGRLG